MFFDTHAHYDDTKFDSDRETVIDDLKQNGVGKVVNIGTDLETSRKSVALACKYDFFYAAIGVYPGNTDEMTEQTLDDLRDLAQEKKVIAIGEIGLDYYWDTPPREVQKTWFRRQILLARELGLPFCVHDREAHRDTLDIIEEVGYYNGLMHCFSGSCEMAEYLLARGFYISIAGQVTFKNAPRLQAVAKMCPMDRLVVETDSPYLTPEPNRGKRNDSRNLVYTCNKIAEIKNITPKALADITMQNGMKFYGIEA